MRHNTYILIGMLASFVAGGCGSKPEEPSGPAQSSAEGKAMADATAQAANINPADALDLAASVAARRDVSDADRAAVFEAERTALKKLREAAATGDAAAKEAMEKFRARK